MTRELDDAEMADAAAISNMTLEVLTTYTTLLITRLRAERERKHTLENEVIQLQAEAAVRQYLLASIQARTQTPGAPPLPVLQAEALVTYHIEAWEEGRAAGLRSLVEELDNCLVCRCIDSDTSILNAVERIVAKHKEELGV
jgi:hypothetical protein